SSRGRHTRFSRDWSSDVCSSDLLTALATEAALAALTEAGHADLSTTALIASTPSPEFPARLAESLGIAGESVLLPDLTDGDPHTDRKSTRLNSSHVKISYAVFCL